MAEDDTSYECPNRCAGAEGCRSRRLCSDRGGAHEVTRAEAALTAIVEGDSIGEHADPASFRRFAVGPRRSVRLADRGGRRGSRGPASDSAKGRLEGLYSMVRARRGSSYAEIAERLPDVAPSMLNTYLSMMVTGGEAVRKPATSSPPRRRTSMTLRRASHRAAATRPRLTHIPSTRLPSSVPRPGLLRGRSACATGLGRGCEGAVPRDRRPCCFRPMFVVGPTARPMAHRPGRGRLGLCESVKHGRPMRGCLARLSVGARPRSGS